MRKKLGVSATLAKSHIDQYVRKDGVVVQAHDDKRQAARPAFSVGDHAKFNGDHVIVTEAHPSGSHFKVKSHDGSNRFARHDWIHGGNMEKVDDQKPQPAAPKPTTPEDVKKHAVAAGAKFHSNVGVFSKPELAHQRADATARGKGGAFVMNHPDHDHHVVVSGADAQRMEKNGYKFAKPGQAAPAAPAKPADPYSHPNVVGHAEKLQGGDAKEAHGFHFAGKEFSASGKEGKSFHDGTPVRHFREQTGSGDDDGQHVWMDHSGRVHADGTSEVKGLRAKYEAHKAKAGGKRLGMKKAQLPPAKA